MQFSHFLKTTASLFFRAGNIVLLQFVVSLKNAIEDEKVAELLVSILKCHPDILHRYFSETQLCFTPRMKGAWLESIALLKKVSPLPHGKEVCIILMLCCLTDLLKCFST